MYNDRFYKWSETYTRCKKFASALQTYGFKKGDTIGFLAMNIQGKYGGYSVYNGFNYALRTQDRKEMVDAKYMRTWE